MSRKVTNNTGRKKNAVASRMRLEQDADKREKNHLQSKVNTSRQLHVDQAHSDLNRSRARTQTIQRLEQHTEYKEQNRARARLLYRHNGRSLVRITNCVLSGQKHQEQPD